MKPFFKFILFTFLLSSILNVYAQESEVLVQGTVLNLDKSPVEFATILLKDLDSEELIDGTTADIEGKFELISPNAQFFAEISFIGFESKVIRSFKVQNGIVNLGQIILGEDNKLLDEVVVRAERSQTEFELDKRVFNVGKDLASTGASALEVLNNVPSVNVNIEGEISLRGSSGVQILINGKPSVLASEQGNALGTITAEMIEKIEVITNPSAKYDAEGTSGIINIIIKKDQRKGLNGSISLNTGVPDNHSIGVSLNRRTEKFNLFSQLGAGYRSLPRIGEDINLNLTTNERIESEGTEYRNETFYNFILGTDYHLNETSVFTLSGNFAYEVETQPSRTNFTSYDGAGNLESEWYREETTEAGNPKWQYDFQFKKDFKDHKDHTLLASALGSFFGKDQSSSFSNTFTSGESFLNNQQTSTNFQEAESIFKIDYTQPFAEKFTWELGSQYVINDVGNDYSVSDFIDGSFVENAELTNDFDYNQKVLAAYSTASFEGEKWGLKLGARVENTDLKTYLATTNVSNNQNYTNLFPTLHTSLKMTKEFSLQAGYSKRIFRPRLWDLNPFFNIRNNFNVRTGNPNLLPEFTDSYEVTAIYLLEKLSLNSAIFHRYTENVVERISTFIDGVSYSKPDNIGTNRSTGFELNGKYTPNKWLTINGDFNYNVFKREGSLEAISFDFNGNSWSSRLNAKFNLPKDIDLEFSGNYRSGYKTVQSVISEQAFANMGVRKKLMKGRGVINISVRDIFASRISISETTQPEFYLYSRDLRGRFVTLGFSYGFGKGEAMEFSGARRR